MYRKPPNQPLKPPPSKRKTNRPGRKKASKQPLPTSIEQQLEGFVANLLGTFLESIAGAPGAVFDGAPGFDPSQFDHGHAHGSHGPHGQHQQHRGHHKPQHESIPADPTAKTQYPITWREWANNLAALGLPNTHYAKDAPAQLMEFHALTLEARAEDGQVYAFRLEFEPKWQCPWANGKPE